MITINFLLKDGTTREIETQTGLSVMEVAVKHKVGSLDGACGGGLSCATCHVYVHPDWWDKVLPKEGEISENEEDMLDLAFSVGKFSRLSCQIMLTEDLDGLIVAEPGTKTDW